MVWQQKFLETFGTGVLGGMSFRTYWKSLRDNGFAVDSPYYLRAAITALSALQNSAQRRLENWRYGEAVRATSVQPPLFVVGLWRSGTTHLHNLLSQDFRFAYPNTYQVFFPHTFLTTESTSGWLMNFLLPAKRVQDNVKLGAQQPQEDDFAIAGLTGMSFNLSIAYCRRAAAYTRFLTFDGVSAAEQQQWSDALHFFLQKLTFKYDRPLVLKSPAHTGHLAELLAMYPDAKFVLIHRDPHEVFSSTVHCLKTCFDMWAMQRVGSYDIPAATIENVRRVSEKYFVDRSVVPAGQLAEVAFTDLERAPMQTMRRLYAELDLPAFRFTEQAMQDYLNSLGPYKKNQHRQLEPAIQAQLAEQWQEYLQNWGYDNARGAVRHAA
jgi:hypothetical protein